MLIIDNYDSFISVLKKYPQAMPLCFSNLIDVYRKYNESVSVYGMKEYNSIFNEKSVIRSVKKILKFHKFITRQKNKIHGS